MQLRLHGSGRSAPASSGRSSSSSSRSRATVTVRAFLKAGDVQKAAIAAGHAAGLPLPVSSCSPGVQFTSATRLAQASDFFRHLAEQTVNGPELLSTIAERWGTTYSLDSVQELSVSEDEGSHDAFVFVASDVINTGSFAGQEPTRQHSQVLGMYRVHLDEDGGVSDMWLWRSGTTEERQHLLKRDVSVPLFQQPWSSGSSGSSSSGTTSAGSMSSVDVVSPSGVLTPCTWPVDHFYTAAIMQQAGLWTNDVMSLGSLSVLAKIAAPSVTMYDGTGLLFAPLTGVAAVGHHLADQMTMCEVFQRKVHAQVVDKAGHKVVQHWTQARTCRTSGQRTEFEGATLLVFDSKARVQQVFEFVSLGPVWRERVFSADAEQRVLGCWPPPSSSAGRAQAGGEAARAAAAARRAEREAKERAEVLARQEREWMSW